MEKALTKVGSLKVGGLWISKKAKEELSNITEDLSTFSNTVEEKAKWIFNKLKGKPLKSLPDLLREYNLPPGLFPQNVICYEFDETKAKLIVYLSSPCEGIATAIYVIGLRLLLKTALGVLPVMIQVQGPPFSFCLK
ncbi:hypothetical protein V6N12_005921 [Hibiscus sabdariffa]|uniref:Uncharacterized protein n=1 Tax=Hibiscus sabdariffa TaxID=183260 RepID=A0ABR2EXP1_9ROSI